MKQYLELMKDVLDNGTGKEDRTGTGTISVFGRQMRFNLQDGFPLVTTKKCHLRSIIHELLWFLKGDTNIKYLNDNGVTIWDEWALKEDETKVVDKYGYELVEEAISKGLYKGSRSDLKRYLSELNNKELAFDYFKKLGLETTKVIKAGKVKGDLGPVYGKQWRDWVAPNGEHIDQIKELIDLLKNDPDSRRIIVSAWNVGELKDMALMPCHSFFQFYTCKLSYDERIKLYFDLLDKDEKLNEKYKLKCYPITGTVNYEQQLIELMDEANIPTRKILCQLYQRSCDVFLGLPFNIASYALLLMMVGQQVNMLPSEFVWTGGDIHIYKNHLEQVNTQLQRNPKHLPTMKILRKPDTIFDYKFEDFQLEDYDFHPAIKAPVAV